VIVSLGEQRAYVHRNAVQIGFTTVLRRLNYPNCVELHSEPWSAELQQRFWTK